MLHGHVQLEEEQDGHQYHGQEHRELKPRRKVRPEVVPGEEGRQGEQAQEREAEDPVHEALALLEQDRSRIAGSAQLALHRLSSRGPSACPASSTA